jgi:hypothetical protein
MRKRLLLFVLSVVLFASSALAYPQSGSGGSRSDSSTSKVSSSQKTVHVRSYTRKDGTVVRSHDRSASGTKASSSTANVRSSKTTTPALRDSRGRIKRSTAAKEEFERETGYSHGRKGYVVDHVVPLACGGGDAPSNMQWQTVAEAKAKDKTERIGCK